MPRFLRNIWELLEMIKIGHSVLALPFAFMGAILAARGLPTGRTTFFILVAMVGRVGGHGLQPPGGRPV